MKKWLAIILLISATTTFAQESPLKKLVNAKKEQLVPFKSITAFTIRANKELAKRGTYHQLELDPSFSTQLLAERPQAIELPIPVAPDKSITCELVRFSLGNIQYTENNSTFLQDIKEPVTYRGIVAGDTGKSIVTLTVNDEYLSVEAIMSDKTILKVTKADEKSVNTYRLYDSRTVAFPGATSIDCGTTDKAGPVTSKGVNITGITSKAQNKEQDLSPKCVNVFVDCFDSMYKHFSSSKQKTVNYVYELFNSVITGYYVAQVNVQITTINVWTTTDPYRQDTRKNALADLSGYYKDNFWGNICVGLDFSTPNIGRSGVAGDIGHVKAVSLNTCPAYVNGSVNEFCYNDLNYNNTITVSNFPVGPNTTQQQVYLVMHEMGHVLGAHHTKWCGWKQTSNPDTYGAIDSCGDIEGTCAQGPPPGSGGATIMSYCTEGNTPNNYINYFNGFGTLPGNAILNFIAQTTCLLNCSDCFGLLRSSSNKQDGLAYNGPVPYSNKKDKPVGNVNPKEVLDHKQSFINLQNIKQ